MNKVTVPSRETEFLKVIKDCPKCKRTYEYEIKVEKEN